METQYKIYITPVEILQKTAQDLTLTEVEFFLSVTDEGKKELLRRWFNRDVPSCTILSEPPGEKYDFTQIVF